MDVVVVCVVFILGGARQYVCELDYMSQSMHTFIRTMKNSNSSSMHISFCIFLKQVPYLLCERVTQRLEHNIYLKAMEPHRKSILATQWQFQTLQSSFESF